MVFSVSDGWCCVLFQVKVRPRAAKLDESRGALRLWQGRKAASIENPRSKIKDQSDGRGL
jgi:hypothetical protein